MRPLITLIAVLTLAGCGGSGDDKPGPGPEPEPKPVVYEPIADADANKVKARMSESALRRLAKVDPVLEQRPTSKFPGGCLFYRMADTPLSNVWQFCFNDEGVSFLLTAISPNQPAPPEGASQRRAALLARADSECAFYYARLSEITRDVGSALAAYGRAGNAANTRAVGATIARFVGNLEATEEQLSAFGPPLDAEDVLTAYLETQRSQIDVLTRARKAFLDGEMQEYDRLGAEFTRLGEEGKRLARDYGFNECSASTFG